MILGVALGDKQESCDRIAGVDLDKLVLTLASSGVTVRRIEGVEQIVAPIAPSTRSNACN